MLLEGGSKNIEGRVRFIEDGVNGTVCDNGWDDNDARVVCRMLGFSLVVYFYIYGKMVT